MRIENDMDERPILKKSVRLKCPKCNRVWIYRGLNPFRTTCGYCNHNVQLSKCKVGTEFELSKDRRFKENAPKQEE